MVLANKVFKDFLGQVLQVGDHVLIGATFDNFMCCEIVRFTPKMVRIQILQTKKEKLLYDLEMVKVDSELITFHMLSKEER